MFTITPDMTFHVTNTSPNYDERFEIIKANSFGMYTASMLQRMAAATMGCFAVELYISGQATGLQTLANNLEALDVAAEVMSTKSAELAEHVVASVDQFFDNLDRELEANL